MKLLRKTIYLSFFVILAVGSFSCKQKGSAGNDKPRVEFFRTILFSETPWDIERGGHSISPTDAKDINAYRFTRDNKGRLLSVEFVRNDVLLGYSSMGGAAKVMYDYIDNKQIKHYFDKDNKQISSGGVYTAEYELDNNGMRIGLKFLDEAGNPMENRNKIASWKWGKLENGMIKENRFNLKGEEVVMNEFCPFYELRFTYDQNGYVIRMANYQADTLYNCTAENCGDIGVSYFLFAPNKYGDVESFSVHNTVGQFSNLYWGWAKRVNTYDENGYVLQTSYFDQDQEYVGGKLIPVTQYTYDKHGSVIKTVNMDKTMKVFNNPETGVAITEYKYDDAGQRVETLRYDLNNVPVNIK
jgi:hypothetical protein